MTINLSQEHRVILEQLVSSNKISSVEEYDTQWLKCLKEKED